jgi:hypothetical protein
LEEALETLEPRFAASTRTGPGRATSASSPSTSEALENQFATLPIEHPTESESTGPATASQTPLPSENHTFHEIEGAKEEEEIEQEKGFAIFCLFKDLKRLQNYISGIWVRYKKQEINLITASAITNAAFQLAIRIQDETLEAFPNCSSYKDAVSAILPHSSQVVKEREEADGSEDGANLAELPFALAHDILDKFCKNIGPSHASLRLQQNTHQLLHYCIALVSPRRSWADRILRVIEKQYPHLTSTGEPASDELAADEPATDGLDTDKLVSDESAKDKLSTDGLATDELTRGLRKMLSTKDIPVWLAFATTVFLDIHHTLEMEVQSNLSIMQAVAMRAQETLVRYLRVSLHDFKPETWPQDLEFFYEKLQKVVPCGLRRWLEEKLSASSLSRSRRFYLFKHHPVLCGITAFSIMLKMQEFGVALANTTDSAMYTAQLYNALRQKPRPIDSWPLMDQVIQLHGESKFFKGDRPTSIYECDRRIGIVLGGSPINYAANRRSLKIVRSKNGPQKLEHTSDMNKIFREALRGDKTTAAALYAIQGLLNNQTPKAPPIQSLTDLLEALGRTFPAELEKLEFNYFRLHQQSINIIQDMVRELGVELNKYPNISLLMKNPTKDLTEWMIVGPNVVTAAIADATRVGWRQNSRRFPEVGFKLLHKVGDVVDKFLKELAMEPDEKPVDLNIRRVRWWGVLSKE